MSRPREGTNRQHGDGNLLTDDRPREGHSRHRDDRETRTHEDSRQKDNRDNLIEALQQKIEHLERNRTESHLGSSNLSNDGPQQKTAMGPNNNRAREPRT